MSRLPTLGSRGQGWVVAQAAIVAATAVAGAAGPAWHGPLRVVTTVAGLGALGAGGVLAVRGARDLGAQLTPLPRPGDRAELVEHGIYARVRHPIYGGILLGALGWALLTASLPALAGAAVLGGFFRLKSAREEAWLAERFPAYAAYRDRTSRFWPTGISRRRRRAG